MKKNYSFERNSGNDVNIVANKKKHKKKSTVLPRIVCLLIAFVLWLGVMYINRKDFEVTLVDIPVELRGADEILDNYGIEAIADETHKVTVTVRGRKNVVQKYTSGNVKAYVVVDRISNAGTYTYEIKLDMPRSDFTTVRTDKTEITVNTVWQKNGASDANG